MDAVRQVMGGVFFFLAVSWPVNAPAAGGVQEWLIVSEAGFSTPESVEYDAGEDVYLITNINGSPFAADGNGFISKVGPDGRVIDLKWIDGENPGITLNAPKGAAIAGNDLFVADRNQVQVFALPGGEQKASITIDGSTFLNGITPGDGDYVYVTDSGYNEGFTPSGSDAIYKVWADGMYEVIAKDEDLGHPNGILENDGRLLVVTFGSGKMFSVDASGKRTPMPAPPGGGLDGLVKLNDGRIAVSSWDDSAVYVADEDGSFTVLADSLDAPADLGVDTNRNRLLIPLFKQNKVVILPL